jgi:hypothetical protein
MKKHLLKTLISLFFLAIPFLGMSQLKVLNTGTVSMGGTNSYNTSNQATLNLYKYNNCTITSYAEFTSAGGDAIKSVVNRGDAVAFAGWHNSSRNFIVYGNGDVWSRTAIYVSDEMLKENILPIENAKSKLRKLNGVSYSFKKRGDKDKNHLGLLAQDVEKIFPEIVYANDSGVKGIAYVELIPVIIEALKEQANEIDALKKELSELKNTKTEKSATIGSNSTIETLVTDLPKLAQNVPNPFSESTRIDIYLPTTVSQAMFYVYNLQGAQVKALAINQRGNTNVIIEGYTLDAGMYLYTLIADGKEVDTKKMILTK